MVVKCKTGEKLGRSALRESPVDARPASHPPLLATACRATQSARKCSAGGHCVLPGGLKLLGPDPHVNLTDGLRNLASVTADATGLLYAFPKRRRWRMGGVLLHSGPGPGSLNLAYQPVHTTQTTSSVSPRKKWRGERWRERGREWEEEARAEG